MEKKALNEQIEKTGIDAVKQHAVTAVTFAKFYFELVNRAAENDSKYFTPKIRQFAEQASQYAKNVAAKFRQMMQAIAAGDLVQAKAHLDTLQQEGGNLQYCSERVQMLVLLEKQKK